MRLGFLFPPCGGEDELYVHGEAMGDDVRVLLMGTRIFGDEDEHAPHHLSRTGALDHLAMHARVMARMRPDAVMWACTSGSFIDGRDHAGRQAETIAQITGCPASSTSLAFVSALRHLGIETAALLASYPEETAQAFSAFLRDCDIELSDVAWLSAPSGPAAAELGAQRLMDEAAKLAVPEGGAILIPDTAMPSMGVIASLEAGLGRTVLTANQVTLWQAVRLAEGICRRPGVGRLFAK
ncbi:MAG: maleate cis-trans isomerase family protein [Hyphomicrobiales bacterium]